MMVTDKRKTSPLLILFAWVLVTIPMGWGLYFTVLNAMKLFQ